MSLCTLLLKYRADLNLPRNEQIGDKDQSAMHLAALNTNPKIYLMMHNARGDRHLPDAQGVSAEEYFETKITLNCKKVSSILEMHNAITIQ